MKRDMIVIGTSAGGVEALQRLVRKLPADLPAAVLIVMHRVPYLPGLLAQILERDGTLPVKNAVDGEIPRTGQIYLAPPDRHLTVEHGVLRVTRGPKENFSRPAIDPLFRSAAREYGPRTVAVILTGTLYDGTAGMATIKERGGFTIVQDPSEAAFSEMPENAIAGTDVDRILPLGEIAEHLVRLVGGAEVPEVEHTDDTKDTEDKGDLMIPEASAPIQFDRIADVSHQNQYEQIQGERSGQTSVFTCPDCSGTLWQVGGESPVQFRCHVGHAFSGESLAVQQSEALERSLWFAIRTLVDRSVLLRQLAENARKHGNESSAQHFEKEARLAEEHAATVRLLIEAPDQVKQETA